MIQRICPYYEKAGFIEPIVHDCCNCKYCKEPMKCKHRQGKKYTVDELHNFAKETFNKNSNRMTYKVGIENRYGNLLHTKMFSSDKEMYEYLKSVNEEFVKTKDLVNAKIIVQVYYPGTEDNFENCLCQYFMNFEENF